MAVGASGAPTGSQGAIRLIACFTTLRSRAFVPQVKYRNPCVFPADLCASRRSGAGLWLDVGNGRARPFSSRIGRMARAGDRKVRNEEHVAFIVSAGPGHDHLSRWAHVVASGAPFAYSGALEKMTMCTLSSLRPRVKAASQEFLFSVFFLLRERAATRMPRSR